MSNVHTEEEANAREEAAAICLQRRYPPELKDLAVRMVHQLHRVGPGDQIPMLIDIKCECIYSTDGVADDRALSAPGIAPSHQGQAMSLDVQNDSSARSLFSAPRPRPSTY
jgi:hypothetical protein